MSEGGEKKKPGLRVDRLAEAMDAARARARGEARKPRAPQTPPVAGPQDRARATGVENPPRAARGQEPGRAADPEEPSRPAEPASPPAPDRPPQPEPTPPAPDRPQPVPEETPAPQEAPPDAPDEVPPAPPETPAPAPEEEPPTAPEGVPPAPDETPPTAPDETPPPAPDEMPPTPDETPPSAPDEIVPPLPDELPGTPPAGDRPQAPAEIPPGPDEIPDRPGETPPGGPDELPPQTPDEVPDWPQARAGPVPVGPDTAQGLSREDAKAQTEAPHDPQDTAPLPPLVLGAPLRVYPEPSGPRDKRRQADRISEAIRQETEARRASPEAPPQSMTPLRAGRPARVALGPPLLTLSGVATDIGRYHILSDVGFEVPTGGVTMLLGRNGAGKTTTLRTIMGLWRAKAGRIALAEEDIAAWAAPRIARSGIGYVPEDMGIFGDLTVAENMALAARSGPLRADRLDWIFATFPPLQTFWRSPAGVLSGGQKQMLAMARAMAEPRRLYLIDEPTKGLAPAIVATLIGALRDLKAQGTSILLVEQNFAVARALGDMAVVMEDGRVAWSGTMPELAADAALQARLMGLSMEGVT